MIVAILIIFQFMGLISSVHAILSSRTSQGAVAWVVSLNTFPLIAVPAYWVLGRNKFEGYVNAWQDRSVEAKAKIKQIIPAFKPYAVQAKTIIPEYEAVKSLTNASFLKGNTVKLLVDGEATYADIIQGLEKAEHYILFQFYIFRADEIGNKFKQLLIQKAQEGLRVYVMYDGLGSSDLTQQWLDPLRTAGVKVASFNTRKGRGNRFQINFRNHRKNVVVDGKYAWIGGLNVGDDYLGKDPKLSPWRDTHMRIEGPSALLAQMAYMSDWLYASQSTLDTLSWRPVPSSELSSNESGTHVLVLASGPADDQETASLFFTNALNAARQRIWIATPYFIPDNATMVALRLALLKNLDVRIITPAHNDNWFVRHASNTYLSELAQLGAKIYFYQAGFMHQKVMLVDDGISMIGTVNFDNRSFRLNFEITSIVAETAFTAEVENMLLKDIENSEHVKNYRLEAQSLWERLKAHGSVLLAPVL